MSHVDVHGKANPPSHADVMPGKPSKVKVMRADGLRPPPVRTRVMGQGASAPDDDGTDYVALYENGLI